MILLALARLFRSAAPAPLPRAELDKLPDEELMRRYADGDALSFELLLARHERSVFHFVLRSVRQRERAEDLTQEVFLRVVRTASRYETRARFTTWLFTIARNVCIDEGRRERHRRTVSLDAPLSDDEPDGQSHVDHVPDTEARAGAGPLVRKEFLRKLEAGLDALPDEQREVFVLRHYEGLRFREIADAFGLSENTVKSRMRYALETLRGHVAEFENYSFDEADSAESGDPTARRQV